jgi:hypothetical protein
VGEGNFRKGTGGRESIERIEHPIQDKEGSLVDRLQSRVDNWSETVARRIVQNVVDAIETKVTEATDARCSYCVLAIEVPSRKVNDSIWSDIKKRLGRWLEENGLEYYFPKKESWVLLHPSIFNKKGELGMKGWDKKKFLDATGAKDMVEELWFNGTYRTIEIEEEWSGLILEGFPRHTRRRDTEEYLLFLHWKIDYPEGE